MRRKTGQKAGVTGRLGGRRVWPQDPEPLLGLRVDEQGLNGGWPSSTAILRKPTTNTFPAQKLGQLQPGRSAASRPGVRTWGKKLVKDTGHIKAFEDRARAFSVQERTSLVNCTHLKRATSWRMVRAWLRWAGRSWRGGNRARSFDWCNFQGRGSARGEVMALRKCINTGEIF